jgi:hypothetical protein
VGNVFAPSSSPAALPSPPCETRRPFFSLMLGSRTVGDGGSSYVNTIDLPFVDTVSRLTRSSVIGRHRIAVSGTFLL